jgi:hypothetical protein
LPPSFDLDHIIPLHRNGEDTFDNIQALCPNCHRLKTSAEILAALEREDVYRLSRVIRSRSLRGRTLYECEWVGQSQTTWEPLENIEDTNALREFIQYLH